MPSYNFKCKECGYEYEDFVMRISDGDKEQECPLCGQPAKKVFSRNTFGVNGCPNTRG